VGIFLITFLDKINRFLIYWWLSHYMTNLLIKDPIYFQATENLRQLLREGGYATGSQFLTEREVAERFGISRATANKALASLVSEGTLEFRKGIGTFVRFTAPHLEYDLRALVSFTEKARAAGKVPTTQVLRLEQVPADVTLANLLRIPEQTPLWAMDRLRLVDGNPVILERRHLLVSACPDITKTQINGSLYALLTEKLGLEVIGATETIQAVNITGTDATLLGVTEGAAGLLVTATALLVDGTPLWQERTLYRGDSYSFHNWLGPIRQTGTASAVGVFSLSPCPSPSLNPASRGERKGNQAARNVTISPLSPDVVGMSEGGGYPSDRKGWPPEGKGGGGRK
jgi:GntR family transcriptional regulator